MVYWKTFCNEMIGNIVVQLRRNLNKLFEPLHFILLFNHTLSCLFLTVGIISLSFLPLAITHSDSKTVTMSGNHYYFVVVEKYREWLLITVTCAGPMLLELLLDIRKLFNNTLDIVSWLSRGLILGSLIFPNLILFALTMTVESKSRSLFPLIQTALLLTKQSIFVTGILMSMFSHKMEGVYNTANRLSISVADWTVYALFCWILNRIFLVAAATVYDHTLAHILDIVRTIFAFFTLFIFLWIIVNVLSFLVKQQVGFGVFQSHEHMSDFYHTLVLLFFIVCEIILNVTFTGHTEDTNNPLAESRLENHGHFIASLYAQVAFTIVLTVIPGRSYQLLADIKQQKLNTRLNLIRYVSHEMRTPLNTAFLGLEMLTSDLHSLQNKYDAANANASASTYNMSDLNYVSTKESSSEPSNKVEQSLSRSGSAYNPPSEQSLSVSPTYKSGNVGRSSSTSISVEVEELEDTVRQVQDSCKVAVETLDDLLTFDKLDENKLVIEVCDLDPWCFLCEAAKPFEINARMQGVTFSLHCSALLDNGEEPGNINWLHRYYINGDKFKLAQVVRNLCSNALKFTPAHGNVTVELSLINVQNSKLREAHVDHAVRVTVIDTGAGISPQNQRKLFGQYVQFNASKLQQGKGSGLGLWISKSIVELHGGTIWAFSEGEGSGSTFGVDLPAFEHREDATIDNECIHEGNHVVSEGDNKSPNQSDGDSPLFRMLKENKGPKPYETERKCDDEAPDIENQLSLNGPKVLTSKKSSDQCGTPTPKTPRANPPNNENVVEDHQLSQMGDENAPAIAPRRSGIPLIAEIDLSIRIPDIHSTSTPIRSKPPLGNELPNSNLCLFDHEVVLKEVISSSPRAVSNSTKNTTPSPAAAKSHHSTTSSERDHPHASSSINNEAIMSRRPTVRGRTNSAPSSIHSSSSSPKNAAVAATSSSSNNPPAAAILPEHESPQDAPVSSITPSFSAHPPSVPLASTNTPSPANPVLSTVEEQQEQTKNWSTGLHFLIVDDTTTNRKMLKKVLMNAGHRVSEAVDGVDCLEQLDYFRTLEQTLPSPTSAAATAAAGERKDPYGSHSTIAHDIDIVLMDECMPRMDGPQCCRILFDKQFPAPIVAVTGTVSEEGTKSFLQAGAVAVLHKPLKVEMLKRVVDELFEQ